MKSDDHKTTILPDGSAFSTATIMSKEEAMALPPKERPICFRLSSELYHDVWQAIGHASMTFKTEAGNEVFNTEEASKIVMDLLFKIANEKDDAFDSGYNSAIYDAASVTNSGMDNYQRIMGLLRK